MGHHYVFHILKAWRDASAWLIWVPTPAGSRSGRMWAQAAHIELRWHNVNIRNVSLTIIHLATVVMLTWAPHPATSGSHRLLADLLMPGQRTFDEKVETFQTLWQEPHPGFRANIWSHTSPSQNLDSGEAPQHCPHYNIIKRTPYYIMIIKKIIYI